MNLFECLSEVESLVNLHRWVVYKSGSGIRMCRLGMEEKFCPLTALWYQRTGKILPLTAVFQVGEQLGMPYDITREFVRGADLFGGGMVDILPVERVIASRLERLCAD